MLCLDEVIVMMMMTSAKSDKIRMNTNASDCYIEGVLALLLF